MNAEQQFATVTDRAWVDADDLGPEKIVHLHRAEAGLRAIVVIDNVAAGPSVGGVRMAPDVSLSECFRLARAMTLKNAAAGLAHGGGKSVIVGDPKMTDERKESLVRAFAAAIGDLHDYVPGPDMGTDERCMAWVRDEIGRAVGLPRELGGIPLDEIGATGLGLAACARAAEDHSGVRLNGARVAVQGFGSVGRHAARFFADQGAVLVAASDSQSTVADPDGLDVAALAAHKRDTGNLAGFAGGRTLERDAIIGIACDIWIPAARPDVIDAANVGRLDTRLVLEGANIPLTADAEAALAAREVLVIPDFIANAGGVICAAVEYAGGTERTARETIEEKIGANTAEVLEHAARTGRTVREVATEMAVARVRTAMGLRRRF